METAIKKPEYAETKNIKLESIVFDDSVQQRDVLANKSSIEGTVKEYAERWREGHEFPAVDLCDTGDQLVIIDGTLRCLSAKEAGLTEIKARICKGTKADAIFWACSANSDHGLQVNTNEDKRRRTTTILTNTEFMARFPSNGAIARYLRVSEGFVRKIKVELGIEKPETVAVQTTDGRSYDLPSKNIGSGSKKKAESKRDLSSKSSSEPAPNSAPKRSNSNEKDSLDKVSSRKQDRQDCNSFDEIVREVGTVDLIISELPTVECLAELRERASELLGDSKIVLMLLPKSAVSSPDAVAEVVKSIIEPSSTVLASKFFRAGTQGARCRYVSMSPDLAIRRPSVTKSTAKTEDSTSTISSIVEVEVV